MVKYKTAKAKPFVYDVICPTCKETIENPHRGSFQFEANVNYPQELFCGFCETRCNTPKQLTYKTEAK